MVWTKNDVHIERIFPDEKFWLTNVVRAKVFFETSILPELLGKFYSRTSRLPTCRQQLSQEPSCSGTSASIIEDHGEDNSNVELETTDDVEVPLYCYCQGTAEGDRVGCDNPSCTHQWFHLSCLKLESLSKCKYWYCPDCRKLATSIQTKRKRKEKK